MICIYTVNILLSLNPDNSNIILLCCKVCSEASKEYSPIASRNLSLTQLRSIFLTDDTHDNIQMILMMDLN